MNTKNDETYAQTTNSENHDIFNGELMANDVWIRSWLL